jgi:hypothetical protein
MAPAAVSAGASAANCGVMKLRPETIEFFCFGTAVPFAVAHTKANSSRQPAGEGMAGTAGTAKNWTRAAKRGKGTLCTKLARAGIISLNH